MATNYSNVVLGDNPLAYYRLGEQSGSVAYDASGYGLNGTYGGGYTLGQSTPILRDNGTAVLFDGSTGYMSTPSHFTDGLTQVSVEFWIKLTTLTLPSSPAVIANSLVGSSHKGLVVYINSNATNVNFNLGNGSTNTTCIGTFTFATGTWYHIVATWNGTTSTVYVNGTSVGTATFSGPIASVTNTMGIAHNPAGSDYFTGYVDEVAIYNYALTSTQVTNHYNTALANNISLYTIPTNPGNPNTSGGGRVVQSIDVNQLVNVLQQPSGGQEKGHYILAEPCYASGATASWYIATLSRVSTPVSVSVDATDVANSGYTTSTPNTDTLKSSGFHLYAFAVTSAQPNPIVGGVYTVQY